jgi:hypothetical protein
VLPKAFRSRSQTLLTRYTAFSSGFPSLSLLSVVLYMAGGCLGYNYVRIWLFLKKLKAKKLFSGYTPLTSTVSCVILVVGGWTPHEICSSLYHNSVKLGCLC